MTPDKAREWQDDISRRIAEYDSRIEMFQNERKKLHDELKAQPNTRLNRQIMENLKK